MRAELLLQFEAPRPDHRAGRGDFRVSCGPVDQATGAIQVGHPAVAGGQRHPQCGHQRARDCSGWRKELRDYPGSGIHTMTTRSYLVGLFITVFTTSCCVAQELNTDESIARLKEETLKTVKKYDSMSCSYTSKEVFVLGGTTEVTENFYARVADIEVWQAGARTIDVNSPATENQKILCASTKFFFHLVRSKGVKEYLLQNSSTIEDSELSDIRNRIRVDNALIYQSTQLGMMLLTILSDRPHIIIYRAIETSAQSGAKGIKFFFTYDMSKSTTPELRKSTQKTDGWFIVLPEYGMAVDSYEYSFSGSINRGYVGSAKYRFGNSQAVLISSKMDTYESNKLVLSREFSDIDFAYGVEINELFLWLFPDSCG